MAALNITRPSGGTGRRGRYKRPQSRYNRPKSNNPNLDLNGEGGSGQVGNTVANAALDAGEVSSNAARQSAIETDMMREDLKAQKQANLTALAQQARGESPEAQAGQTRGIQMREERDNEAKKRQFRATAGVMGGLRNRMGEAKDGMIKLSPKEQAGLTDMIPGYQHRLDENGKLPEVIVRTEPSGEPGSKETVLSFYTRDPEGQLVGITNRGGNPVRVNTKVAQRMADLFDLDAKERTGFPGAERKRQAEEAAIDLDRAKAAKARGEGEYYSAGGAQAKAQTFSQKDRQAQLLNVQKEINDLAAKIGEYRDIAGVEPPQEMMRGLEALDQQKRMLMRGGGAIPTAPAGPAGGGPPVGTERGGFRFIGGNPNNQASWERI